MTHPLVACRALLLDMDGTLVDSQDAVDAAWVQWAEQYGVATHELLAVCRGQEAVTTIRNFRPSTTDAEMAAMVDVQVQREIDAMKLCRPAEGAAELIGWMDASRVPWAVVTNAPRELAVSRLAAAGIMAPMLVGVDDVPRGKPDPAGYRRGAELLGLAPAQTVAVEDSDSGVAAARDAGTIVVSVGEHVSTGAVDVACSGLPELLELLAAARAAGQS